MKTICLDFDGVLHGYSRGWQDGVIYDPPMEGCYEALKDLASHYRLVVCTARDEPHDSVWAWLREHGLMKFVDDVTSTKPKAAIYVDDRAVHHVSWQETLRTIRNRMEGDTWKEIL